MTSPTPTETFRLADMTYRKSRRQWIVPTVCVAVVAVLAGAAGLTYGLTRRAEPAASVPAPSPSPGPSLALRSEQATCLVLVPVLNRTVDVLTPYVQGGTKPDAAVVDELDAEYRDMIPRAPMDMRNDIATVFSAVPALRGGEVDAAAVPEAAVRLLERCRKYATR